MKKTTNIFYGFSIAVLISISTIIPFTLLNLSRILYFISIGVICLIVSSITFNRNRIFALSLFLTFILIFSSFLAINIIQNTKNSEMVLWNSPNESIKIDLIVGKGGHLFLKGKMNGITGLFLFDTGAEISFLNEKYITDIKGNYKSYTISDSKDIRKNKNLYKVEYFELGAIGINDLEVFPADSLMWKDPNGIFYNQDSIIGVIGNNIISKLIWDFDMEKRQVTISNSNSYCKSIPDSFAIELVPIGKHKEIIVRINGKLKRLTLDFGSHFPISLSDSIPNKSVKNSRNSQDTKSAFNHLDTNKGKDNKFDFVDFRVGSYNFKEIQCFENDGSALLGMPFIWTFKRVIIDFINNKAFFISLNKNTNDFGIMKFTRQSVLNADGTTIFYCTPEGTPISDGINRYVGYGKLTIYKHNSRLDSIICNDSIKLPDGRMKYGLTRLITEK